MKKKYAFKSLDGETYIVKIPKPIDMKSFFVFALPKSGSSLLDKIMRDICSFKKIPTISIANDAFQCGVPFVKIGSDIEKVLHLQGYAYLGFRHFFDFQTNFDFSINKKIFLIRDPRDIMVSLYFSLKQSHVIPKKGTAALRLRNLRKATQLIEINEYVVANAKRFVNIFEKYHKKINFVRTFRQ